MLNFMPAPRLCPSAWLVGLSETDPLPIFSTCLTCAGNLRRIGIGETKAKYPRPSPLAVNTHGCQFTRYPTLQNRSRFARTRCFAFCVSGSQCVRTGFHGHPGDGCFGGRITTRGEDGDLRVGWFRADDLAAFGFGFTNGGGRSVRVGGR